MVSSLVVNLSFAENSKIDTSRENTIVDAPITFSIPENLENYEWKVIQSPENSKAEFLNAQRSTTTISPDIPGKYQVKIRAENYEENKKFFAKSKSELLEKFAPRIHFHQDSEYRPTRIEAIVNNSKLMKHNEIVKENITVFDLKNRSSSYFLELKGEKDDYPKYQEEFPKTIYANINFDTEFRGENYIGITYWLIYTYDPKHGIARAGSHQADVESTIILLNKEKKSPEYIAPSAHGSIAFTNFRNFTDENHPDLYPEHKSHATYLTNSSKTDRDEIQIYPFWIAPQLERENYNQTSSALHSERTGSAEVWEPEDYDIIELTGEEIWSSYKGGLDSEPDSITGPHQRKHYYDQGSHIEEVGFSYHDLIQGNLELVEANEKENEKIVKLDISNSGGKPHNFWIVAKTEKNQIIETKSIEVGTESPCFLTLGLIDRPKTSSTTVSIPIEYWNSTSIELRTFDSSETNYLEDEVKPSEHEDETGWNKFLIFPIILALPITLLFFKQGSKIKKTTKNNQKNNNYPGKLLLFGGIFGIIGSLLAIFMKIFIPESTALGFLSIFGINPPIIFLFLIGIFFSSLPILKSRKILKIDFKGLIPIICGIMIFLGIGFFGIISLSLLLISGFSIKNVSSKS